MALIVQPARVLELERTLSLRNLGKTQLEGLGVVYCARSPLWNQ
jgi:hypothetical protein